MTPEEVRASLTYDPDPWEPNPAPPRLPFPWVGFAIFGLWCLVAVAVAVYFAVGM